MLIENLTLLLRLGGFELPEELRPLPSSEAELILYLSEEGNVRKVCEHARPVHGYHAHLTVCRQQLRQDLHSLFGRNGAYAAHVPADPFLTAQASRHSGLPPRTPIYRQSRETVALIVMGEPVEEPIARRIVALRGGTE